LTEYTMVASGSDDFDTVLALEAAWVWALDHRPEAPTLGRVARRLRAWSQSNGGYSGLRELASRTLACGPAKDADTVTVHAAAADLLVGVGDRPQDLDVALAERLVAEARSVDDVPARFHAIGTAAMIYAKAGLTDRSMPLSAEALDLLESEPGLHHLRGAQLGDTAVAQYFAGDLETAAQIFERAIQACLESGDVRNAGVNRLNLAELMLDRCNPASALNLLQTTLKPGGEVPIIVRVLSLSLLVEAHHALGNVEAARSLAPDADRELSDFVTREPSLVAYLDRLRTTLAKLAD
jgi:tetratricopeptide (TPR) repeat protein